MIHITKVFFSVSVFLFSLLAFPSVLPWTILFWILFCLVTIIKERPFWLPLAACFVILMIKFLPRTPATVTLACLLFILGIIAYYYRESPLAIQRIRWWSVAGLLIVWGWFALEWHSIANTSREIPFDVSRPIVCIGDSLTDGFYPDHGYPAALAEMVTVQVINLGFSGIATSQGLGEMDRVLSHNPQIVIIELGGHDFLKGRSRAATKANLVEMITRCHQQDTEVVLMEIPRGFMFDPFFNVEREIAYEYDVQLVDDSWLRQIVLMSPIAPPGKWMPKWQLSDDGIHSNPRGSRKIAMDVARLLGAMDRRLLKNAI